MRIAVSLVLAAVLLASGSLARAARPASGNWSGTVSRSTATVSFRVDRSRTRILRLVVRNFPVYCNGQGTSFDAWVVPSVRVGRDGRFNRTYRPDHPRRRSKFIVRGRFTSAGRLTGYLEEQSAYGICVGGLPWHAHRRR